MTLPAPTATQAVMADVEAARAADAVHTWLELALDHSPWLGNLLLSLPVWQWLCFGATFVLLYTGLRMGRWLVRRAARRANAALGQASIDELIAAVDPPAGMLIFAFAARASFAWLALPDESARLIHLGWRIAAIGAVGWAAFRSAHLLARVAAGVAARRGTTLDDHLAPLIGRVGRVAVAGLTIVLVVEELGYNVAGLVAGLGIGGLAVALAAQDTLGNWFGAATMYTDRPFEIGDWIKSGEIEGTVEDVGLRSTRIRTFARTELTVPNRVLAAAVIENFSRMQARRARYVLTLRYSTTLERLQDAMARLKQLINEHPGIERDNVVVRLQELGPSSLDVLVQFFTLETSLDGHLATREAITAATLKLFAELDIQFAYPTQSLHIETVAPPGTDAARTR